MSHMAQPADRLLRKPLDVHAPHIHDLGEGVHLVAMTARARAALLARYGRSIPTRRDPDVPAPGISAARVGTSASRKPVTIWAITVSTTNRKKLTSPSPSVSAGTNTMPPPSLSGASSFTVTLSRETVATSPR